MHGPDRGGAREGIEIVEEEIDGNGRGNSSRSAIHDNSSRSKERAGTAVDASRLAKASVRADAMCCGADRALFRRERAGATSAQLRTGRKRMLRGGPSLLRAASSQLPGVQRHVSAVQRELASRSCLKWAMHWMLRGCDREVSNKSTTAVTGDMEVCMKLCLPAGRSAP